MEKKVTVIPQLPKLPKRERVAAYARVSTGKDSMLHSLAAQVDYYAKLIRSNPMWDYAGVYADNAQTGTKENRPEFQRLLADCREGKIDRVLVKSISRFARNTVTLLEIVRELRALGIDIYFEEQNLHTLSGDGELMLTILASFAEAESKSVSDNCLWRIQKKMEKGECGVFNIYGYRFQDRRLVVEPTEAAVVKRIFQMYLDGMGTASIANTLNEEGIPPLRGEIWRKITVATILRDEKYTGNMLLQKSFRVDPISKRKVKNNGERRQYLVSDSHEPVIDSATFDRVQEEIARRADLYEVAPSKPMEKHPLAGKIVCGICGKSFHRKFGNTKAQYKAPIWICSTYLTRKKAACPSRRISEKVLFPILAEVLGVDEPLDAVDRIDRIVVYPDGRLTIMVEGCAVERTWSNPSRSESWTDEMRLKAAQKARSAERSRENAHSNRN